MVAGEIGCGDVILCENKWYGRVSDIARTEDGEVIAYYVNPFANPQLVLWVDSNDVVLYAALSEGSMQSGF